MKKHVSLIALLLIAALLFSACSAGNNEPEAAGQGQAAPMDNNQTISTVALPADYDPASEEDVNLLPAGAYDANGNRIYAGATPIPIDPIDMPTPTPRAELTFTYGNYTADKLGLTFEAPVGYTITDSIANTYILTEPAASVKDNYPCVIVIEITSITKNHTMNDVSKDLAAYLQNEGKQYDTWDTYQAATTTVMGKQAHYNNYRGVLADGTIVRGRVAMAIISDNQMLTIHVSCPGWFNSSYMKVFDQVRKTIKRVQ
ncbi:MAG: hypothetical protein IJS53_01265 [Clostridia bacterium]|nr:hypothetical protein [Clostridia bacterium]